MALDAGPVCRDCVLDRSATPDRSRNRLAHGRHRAARGRRSAPPLRTQTAKQLHHSRDLASRAIQRRGECSPLSRREHERRTVAQNTLGALSPAFHEKLRQRLVARGRRAAKQLIVARRDRQMHYFGFGRGVTFYACTSDQRSHYASRVVRTSSATRPTCSTGSSTTIPSYRSHGTPPTPPATQT